MIPTRATSWQLAFTATATGCTRARRTAPSRSGTSGFWRFFGVYGDRIIYLFVNFRAPGCQTEYESRAAVNTVVMHPNQVNTFISAARSLSRSSSRPPDRLMFLISRRSSSPGTRTATFASGISLPMPAAASWSRSCSLFSLTLVLFLSLYSC